MSASPVPDEPTVLVRVPVDPGIFSCVYYPEHALRVAVATRSHGLGLCLNLLTNTMRCGVQMPLRQAEVLFFWTPLERLEAGYSEPAPPACWGCAENQPNQLAHMEPGGCCYQEEDY
jgi:hypothetical protein